MISEYERLAYGIGGLTPAEFGDLTPAELSPYITARFEREKEQVKMENERIGLIAAVLQNGIPTVSVKKTNTSHKPSDYFGKSTTDKPAETRKSTTERIYNTMLAWVGATTKGGK